MEDQSTPKKDKDLGITDENTTGATGKEIPQSQAGGVTDKHDKNAGSGAFNQGSAQDLDPDRGASDQTPNPERVSREPQNPKTPLDNDELN